MIPSAKVRYMPRKHWGILSRAVREAWQAYQASTALADSAAVGEGLAQQLEALYPAEDMAVLAKYGQARYVDHARIAIYSGKSYSEHTSLQLPRKVQVPGGDWSSLYACGPRYSEEPGRGVNADYRAKLAVEGKWEEFCADQIERERKHVAKAHEPFFAAILEARQAYNAEYRQSTAWPTEYRQEHGKYPTWGEIAERFPVLGAYLRQQWDLPLEVAA